MVASDDLTSVSRAVVDAVAQATGSAPVAVALGGGADSAVAAWAVARRGDDRDRAVFVDHRLGSSALLRDASEAVAAAVGLPLVVVGAPVPDGRGVETRARRARYGALEEVAAPDEVVVVAHTRDDQVETVLDHLLRGSGTTGLAGIPPRRNRFVRPLLGFSRNLLRALAEALELPFVDDPANRDLRHLRNRIRLHLVPTLERAGFPDLRTRLARSAELLAADDAVLERLAEDVPIRHDGDAVLLPGPVLHVVDDAVAARAVRRALRRHLHPYPGGRRDVETVFAVARGELPRATITGGLVVEREGPEVAIHRGEERPASPVSLPVPGAVRFGRFLLEARPVDAGPVGGALVDAAVARRGLAVRAAAVGDRIGLRVGSKPVADLLAEAGVPRRLRRAWPLLVEDANIASVPPLRTARWAEPIDGAAVAVTVRREAS